jgi:hypothetical protein
MSCTGGGNATHPPPADKVQSETDRHEGDASWLAEHSSNIGVGHGQQGKQGERHERQNVRTEPRLRTVRRTLLPVGYTEPQRSGKSIE